MRHSMVGSMSAVLMAALLLPATAKTLNVPSQYPTIQSAVNAAHPGDTVQVSAGTYAENVVINTASITLKGLSGATMDGTTLITGYLYGSPTNPEGNDGILVNASSVTITGMTVQNYNYTLPSDGVTPAASIEIAAGTSNCVVKNDTLQGSQDGFRDTGNHTQVTNNQILDNGVGQGGNGNGADLEGTSTTFQSNTCEGNMVGVYVGVGGLTIQSNFVENNPGDGIDIYNPAASSPDHVQNNTVTGNVYNGILLNGVGNTATSNVISKNGVGVYLDGVYTDNTSNVVSNNSITYNGVGVLSDTSFYATISSNSITNSTTTGIWLTSSFAFTEYATVSNDGIANNGGDGILMDYAQLNTIKSLSSNSNGHDGIYITNNGAIQEYSNYGNTVTNCGAYGNAVYDAEDDNPPGTNTWKSDGFGKSDPPGLGH